YRPFWFSPVVLRVGSMVRRIAGGDVFSSSRSGASKRTPTAPGLWVFDLFEVSRELQHLIEEVSYVKNLRPRTTRRHAAFVRRPAGAGERFQGSREETARATEASIPSRNNAGDSDDCTHWTLRSTTAPACPGAPRH